VPSNSSRRIVPRMETEPIDLVADASQAHAAQSRLNTRVAVTVALLATFMGVCKVKDDNIVQAMQQAQADRIDHWGFYQARNLREQMAQSTADQLRAQAIAFPANSAVFTTTAARYDSLAANEAVKKLAVRRQAEQDQVSYDALNYRDDQFDLSDALAAIAISLLALTALTQKRWLYVVALSAAALAALMGLAGLLEWHLHSDALARMLS
jgi:Domain of unknown function (DUF4337)